MKTPDPTIIAESSAPNSANFTGTFPVRHNTVIAEVLTRLVSGENLTGMNAVFDASTTRLSGAIHRLINEYGWHIDHVDMSVGTKDGRMAEIRAYFLTSVFIRQAFDTDAAEFCRSVREARAKLRSQAVKASSEAKRRNMARDATKFNPRQLTLEC